MPPALAPPTGRGAHRSVAGAQIRAGLGEPPQGALVQVEFTGSCRGRKARDYGAGFTDSEGTAFPMEGSVSFNNRSFCTVIATVTDVS